MKKMSKSEKKRFDRFMAKAVSVVQTPWTYVMLARFWQG